MSITSYPDDERIIQYKDNYQIDAFSRLRVSEPLTLFENKQISDNGADVIFFESTTGSGTATYQYDRSSTYLTCTTVSGDKVIRQSKEYLGYLPGKSQLIILTGVFGAGKANVDQYVGYGDDLNGLFFKLQGTSFGIVKRTAVSGTAVDTFVAQSSWNIDVMDGTGESGVNLDVTKAQIFVIDLQWLGVGRVRFGICVDGVIYYVHELLSSNSATSVYMKTASLPIRYEIENTGTAGSGTTLEQICSTVISEGGSNPYALEYAYGNGTTTVGVTTRRPVFAIRLKTAYPTGEPNRKTARLLDFIFTTSTNDAYMEIVKVTSPSSVTGTFSSVNASSAVEYSTNISAITGTEHVVKTALVFSANPSKEGSLISNVSYQNVNSLVTQNIDSTNSDVLVVFATPSAGTANVTAELNWLETE